MQHQAPEKQAHLSRIVPSAFRQLETPASAKWYWNWKLGYYGSEGAAPLAQPCPFVFPLTRKAAHRPVALKLVARLPRGRHGGTPASRRDAGMPLVSANTLATVRDYYYFVVVAPMLRPPLPVSYINSFKISLLILIGAIAPSPSASPAGLRW